MAYKNTTTQQHNKHIENDFLNCRKCGVGGTGLVECQMEISGCQWAFPFGKAHFCNHPSAGQFVNPT